MTRARDTHRMAETACPVDTAPATEVGRLVARILEITPSAGLFAEISIKPAPEQP